VFLDLDGPLVDVSARYFAVHARILAARGVDPGDSRAWWDRKRRGLSNAALLAEARIAVPGDDYARDWLAAIEGDDVLALDRPVPGAIPALAAIAAHHPVVLVTLRQRCEALGAQLDRLGITPYLAAVRCASPLEGPGGPTKARLIGDGGSVERAVCIVGDTEVDVEAGRRVGLRTVAVASGIRDRAALAALLPDVLVDDLAAWVAAGRPVSTQPGFSGFRRDVK